MTGEARDTSAQSLLCGEHDIVDAEFEVVADASPGFESAGQGPAFDHSAHTPGGMEMLRPARALRAGSFARGGPIFWLAGISLAAMAFWVSGGHAVVRAAALPFARQATALRLAEVSSRVDGAGRKGLLVVEGAAINDGAIAAVLPPIDIIVSANDGKILRYRLGTAASQVAPGARWDFSSRLDLPMNGIKAVTVAFSE
ncbi:hypothetical protein [Aminobacter sp. HY435]|uniref:hypothetical protein n=1 Tax=Aminobacter sp. HY435 TaxID=2970917 RepID=UPI0022B98AEC|nr:hypothetical protein [Aminobacter sp. HY435]